MVCVDSYARYDNEKQYSRGESSAPWGTQLFPVEAP